MISGNTRVVNFPWDIPDNVEEKKEFPFSKGYNTRVDRTWPSEPGSSTFSYIQALQDRVRELESKLAQSNQAAQEIEYPELPQNEVKELEALYEVRDADYVMSFLAAHAFLLPILKEAPQKIRAYFGDGIGLALSIYADPEYPAWEEVLIHIIVGTFSKEVFDIDQKFSEEWWCERVRGTNLSMSTMLEYDN
jgi:hypothetical protein